METLPDGNREPITIDRVHYDKLKLISDRLGMPVYDLADRCLIIAFAAAGDAEFAGLQYNTAILTSFDKALAVITEGRAL